jgi:TetR/AcrR family acrAB operon transcriptional repressor
MGDLDRLLAQAVERGQLPEGTSVGMAAIGLHALIDGLMHNWLLNPESFDLEAVGAQALDAHLAGLAAP